MTLSLTTTSVLVTEKKGQLFDLTEHLRSSVPEINVRDLEQFKNRRKENDYCQRTKNISIYCYVPKSYKKREFFILA